MRTRKNTRSFEVRQLARLAKSKEKTLQDRQKDGMLLLALRLAGMTSEVKRQRTFDSLMAKSAIVCGVALHVAAFLI